MEDFSDKFNFKIVHKIADGGMGAVFKALQKGVEGFEKTVAIKTLLEPLTADPRFVEMFIAEAKLVSNLVHENIVQIYQLGKQGGSYYFVLEYVNGVSLHTLLEFHRKLYVQLPLSLSVYIASRVARGLAYAHTRTDNYGRPLNIAHCDVCPSNILITTEGLPKLTDFGIARAANLASFSTMSGKLPFMSPEQASKGAVDHRSDIYSLGIVLFNMLSGTTTRALDKGPKDVLRQARENYIDWSKLPEEVDADLRSILQRMLAGNPDDRYQRTPDLGRDLEYYIYKDGYGPTIVTLSEYLKQQLPGLFQPEALKKEGARPEDDIDSLEKTIRIP
jgi:serine/threonine protein kinase